jgi:hypothetical protein
MSHQFTWYALTEDFSIIQEKLRQIEPFVMFYSRSPTAAPRTASALDFKDESGIYLYYYLARDTDASAVMTRYVAAQGCWVIDGDRSPVIECIGCFFDNKILRSGRMYYTDGDYDRAGTWVWKSEGFRKWAAAVFRVTKKCLVRKDRDYIGPAAAKWLETSGGKLVSF